MFPSTCTLEYSSRQNEANICAMAEGSLYQTTTRISSHLVIPCISVWQELNFEAFHPSVNPVSIENHVTMM
jgi:hypothetical protein